MMMDDSSSNQSSSRRSRGSIMKGISTASNMLSLRTISTGMSNSSSMAKTAARRASSIRITGMFDSLMTGTKKTRASWPAFYAGAHEENPQAALVEEDEEEDDDQRSLLEQVGGREALKAVVEVFYEHLTKDKDLAPFFEHVPLAKLKMHQVRFFCMALGGSAPGMITGVNTYCCGSENTAAAERGVDLSAVDPKILYLVEKHERLFRVPHLYLTAEHFDRVVRYFCDTLANDFHHSRRLVKKVVDILAPYREAFELGAKLYGPNSDTDDATSSGTGTKEEKYDQHLQEVSAKLGNEDNTQAKAILCELSEQLTKDMMLSPFFNNMDVRAMQHHQLVILHNLLCVPPFLSSKTLDRQNRRHLLIIDEDEDEDEDDVGALPSDDHDDSDDSHSSGSSKNESHSRHLHVELLRQHANMMTQGGFTVQHYDRFVTVVTDTLLFMQVNTFLTVQAEEVLQSYRRVFHPRKDDEIQQAA